MQNKGLQNNYRRRRRLATIGLIVRYGGDNGSGTLSGLPPGLDIVIEELAKVKLISESEEQGLKLGHDIGNGSGHSVCVIIIRESLECGGESR